MLLFVYTATWETVIFTCRYFKLSWNTSALSQSNCRNYSLVQVCVIKWWRVKLGNNFWRIFLTKRKWNYFLISLVTVWLLFNIMGDKFCLHTEANNRLGTLSNSSRRIISMVFSRLLSSHNFSKTLTQLIVLFRAFKFSAASFNSITSSRVTVFKNLDAILALIEIQELLPWQFFNFTCEIIN